MTNEEKKTKALVVEDSKELFEAIKLQMEKLGIEVLGAHSFDQASEFLNNESDIDFAWCDHYLLGEGTGLDLVMYMKKDENLRSIPIFVVSVSGGELRKQYEGLGIELFFEKSNYSLGDIINKIKEHIGEKKGGN